MIHQCLDPLVLVKIKGGGVDVSRALVKIKSGRAEVCPASEVLPAKEARSSGAPAKAGGSQSDESRRFFAVLREKNKGQNQKWT